MTTYRGMRGHLVIGGYIVGASIAVDGVVSAGGSSVDIDGTALTGVILPGDTFTVTGVSGTYTVTNTSALVASSNAIAGITFTPVAPAGGFPDDAAFLLTSNSVLNMREWNITITGEILDTTVMGDFWHTCKGGLATYSGALMALFDYDDPVQAALVDQIATSNPSLQMTGFFAGIQGGAAKGFYGAPLLSNMSVESPLRDIVIVRAGITGNAELLIVWQ